MSSRTDYQRRVNLVLDHIDRHYAEPLSLEKLATVAAFSPYHFHRVFSAVVGQTVQGWVNRIRLERAAQCLRYQPNRSITDIAFACGFSTSSNFARAFKLAFGQSASSYRISPNSKNSQAVSNDGNARVAAGTHSRDVKSTFDGPLNTVVRIQSLPGFRVAYVRHFGGYRSDCLAQAWGQIIRFALSRGLVTQDTRYIGIPRDDDTVTSESECRYDACITVGPEFVGSEGVNSQEIPDGNYAVWSCAKRPDEVAVGWQQFVDGWLLDSGFEPEWGPGFERYDSAEPDGEGRLQIQYCIPIRAL